MKNKTRIKIKQSDAKLKDVHITVGGEWEGASGVSGEGSGRDTGDIQLANISF